MIEFNSDHIVVGQIKQLLATFNLPTYRVYTKENQIYYDMYGEERNIVESVPITDAANKTHIRYIEYIKNNKIQRFYDNEWHDTNRVYFYNKKELNHTKNLKIQNNLYDTYTHEYLGNYLRFQRDYNNINMMPFYNCFSNRLVQHLSYNFILAGETPTENKQIIFDSEDTKYKIYMVPVKMFNKYTIAIDSSEGLELCCGIYGQYQDTREKLKNIPALTYLKVNSCNFSAPFLYSGLDNIIDFMQPDSAAELATVEKDLKLFIKLPANNKSSIVILEGNYLNWNDKYVVSATIQYLDPEDPKYDPTKSLDNPINFSQANIEKNHSINNYDETNIIRGLIRSDSNFIQYLPDINANIDYRNLNLITTLQLLLLNTGIQYPFSNILIEFLTGNMVTPIDEIDANIKRAQQIAVENGNTNVLVDGIWSQKLQMLLYDFVNAAYSRNKLISSEKLDTTGFIDKEVESHYNSIVAHTDPNKGTLVIDNVINTLRDINLYENTFRNTYKGRKK